MKKLNALITGVILAAVTGVASAQFYVVRPAPAFVCVQNNSAFLVRACDQFGNCTRVLGPGATGRLVYTSPFHQMMPVHHSGGFYYSTRVFYPNRGWVSFAKTTYLAPGDRLILGGTRGYYNTFTGNAVPVLVPSIVRNACGPFYLVR